VVQRDLGLHLGGAIQCRGDLSKDLAGSVQFPRDLVRSRTSGPLVAVEPGARCAKCGTEVTIAADGEGADEAETVRALAALAARISAAGLETAAARRARSSATARTGAAYRLGRRRVWRGRPTPNWRRCSSASASPACRWPSVRWQRSGLALTATRSPTAGASPSWRGAPTTPRAPPRSCGTTHRCDSRRAHRAERRRAGCAAASGRAQVPTGSATRSEGDQRVAEEVGDEVDEEEAKEQHVD